MTSKGDTIYSRYVRGSSANKNLFAERLNSALEQQNLTYEGAAERIRQHLPQNSRLSGVSVWQYANEKAFPRRKVLLAAISRALNIEVSDIMATDESSREARDPVVAVGQAALRIMDERDGCARVTLNCRVAWADAIRIIDSLVDIHQLDGINETS